MGDDDEEDEESKWERRWDRLRIQLRDDALQGMEPIQHTVAISEYYKLGPCKPAVPYHLCWKPPRWRLPVMRRRHRSHEAPCARLRQQTSARF